MDGKAIVERWSGCVGKTQEGLVAMIDAALTAERDALRNDLRAVVEAGTVIIKAVEALDKLRLGSGPQYMEMILPLLEQKERGIRNLHDALARPGVVALKGTDAT